MTVCEKLFDAALRGYVVRITGAPASPSIQIQVEETARLLSVAAYLDARSPDGDIVYFIDRLIGSLAAQSAGNNPPVPGPSIRLTAQTAPSAFSVGLPAASDPAPSRSWRDRPPLL